MFLHPVIPIKHMIHCMLLDMFIRLFTKLNFDSSWKKFCTVKVQLLEQARYIYAKRWINLLIPTTCVPLSYDVFIPFNLFFSVLIIICVTKINVLIDLWWMARQRLMYVNILLMEMGGGGSLFIDADFVYILLIYFKTYYSTYHS